MVDSVLRHIGKQFLLQDRRAPECQRAAAVVQLTMALPYQFRRDLVQTLERQIYGGEQFDKQVAAVFSRLRAVRRSLRYSARVRAGDAGPVQRRALRGR